MKNSLSRYSAAALLLLLAGCATVTKPPEGTVVPPGSVQPAPGGTVVPPAEGGQPAVAAEPVVIEPVQKEDMSHNRAVVALLTRAQADVDAGKPDAAGALLERALHIEPRNPWVWQQLAQTRLNAGRYDQAISLARKSNSFSGGKHMLQAVNWQLIAKARVAKGDSTGADDAFRKANELAVAGKAEVEKAGAQGGSATTPAAASPVAIPHAP